MTDILTQIDPSHHRQLIFSAVWFALFALLILSETHKQDGPLYRRIFFMLVIAGVGLYALAPTTELPWI